jgi:hypothetical protein
VLITESTTETQAGYADRLAYGLLGNHRARLRIHVDSYHLMQSYARVELWTSVGWKEHVQLLPGTIRHYKSEADDLGLQAMTDHLVQLSEQVKPR